MLDTKSKLALIFNEWMKRYNEDPEQFQELTEDYCEDCAGYFIQLDKDLKLNLFS